MVEPKSGTVGLSPIVDVHLVVVSLSGNALVSISVATLHRARLVLGWVTVYKQVNHLGLYPVT